MTKEEWAYGGKAKKKKSLPKIIGIPILFLMMVIMAMIHLVFLLINYIRKWKS